ncbi:DUF726 domain containing protein [Niveomyces insectorum RCEF 264]|uniref:DUF726 domain containing protein n=1 Tax=Niveomyces insectorum RCEF 264 TaxID=1081102 RepID=A0A167NUN9_9HYPO|nr:DUF726 domain containing protein [Niveomyces insectorum RCEF 264]
MSSIRHRATATAKAVAASARPVYRRSQCRHSPRTTWRVAQQRCSSSSSGSSGSSDRGGNNNNRSLGGADAGSHADVAKLLEHPTWSVRSLLSDETSSSAAAEQDAITPAQLRHLLRLSALPCPSSPAEQQAKIDTLRTQLCFVRDVQSVDTTGLRPLPSIRDETRAGLKEQAIGVEDVQQALLQEESFGHNRRPRRRKQKPASDTLSAEAWDVLGTATRKAGRYIVVEGADH